MARPQSAANSLKPSVNLQSSNTAATTSNSTKNNTTATPNNNEQTMQMERLQIVYLSSHENARKQRQWKWQNNKIKKKKTTTKTEKTFRVATNIKCPKPKKYIYVCSDEINKCSK